MKRTRVLQNTFRFLFAFLACARVRGLFTALASLVVGGDKPPCAWWGVGASFSLFRGETAGARSEWAKHIRSSFSFLILLDVFLHFLLGEKLPPLCPGC